MPPLPWGVEVELQPERRSSWSHQHTRESAEPASQIAHLQSFVKLLLCASIYIHAWSQLHADAHMRMAVPADGSCAKGMW
jgi:hypothetical protein